MADTYSQMQIQIVFAVKHRLALIESDWEEALYKYITGVIQNRKHKLLSINGMPDHIHIYVGLNPTQSVAELVKEIKVASSNWINKQGFCYGKFEWQSGYGAFSYSSSHSDKVINYFKNQKLHHKNKSFKEEYSTILSNYKDDLDSKCLFQDVI